MRCLRLSSSRVRHFHAVRWEAMKLALPLSRPDAGPVSPLLGLECYLHGLPKCEAGQVSRQPPPASIQPIHRVGGEKQVHSVLHSERGQLLAASSVILHWPLHLPSRPLSPLLRPVIVAAVPFSSCLSKHQGNLHIALQRLQRRRRTRPGNLLHSPGLLTLACRTAVRTRPFVTRRMADDGVLPLNRLPWEAGPD